MPVMQELLGCVAVEDRSGDPGNSIPASASHYQLLYLLCGPLSELPCDQLNQHRHLSLLDPLLTALRDSLLTAFCATPSCLISSKLRWNSVTTVLIVIASSNCWLENPFERNIVVEILVFAGLDQW